MRDDMMPRPDRSIRNIPVSTAHRRPLLAREQHFEPMPPRPKKRRWFVWAIVIVVIVCGILGLLLSTLFAGASITVFTRQVEVTPPASLTAQVNVPQGNLAYVSMTVTRAASTSVSAAGTKQVSRPASGVITIYNAFNTSEQRLITNTRFEAPDGKIYRIHEPITVPGGTKNADNTLKPGSISATVYADSPGESYNRGKTRFTIPGFKNDPRYSAFYADADAITGGFVGSEPAIAATDLTRAQTALRQELERSINSAVTSQLPEGFVPIANAFDISYKDISQIPSGNGTATLSQSATAVAAIVRVTDLAAALARSGVSEYKGEEVTISNINDVTLGTGTTTRPTGPITFSIAGKPILVWQYDPTALKQALLGKEKSTFESILESFRPAITKAEAKVRPFWQSTFPSDPEKITITTGVSE